MNYKVEIISSQAQVIHTRVTFLPTGVQWWASIVYVFNRIAERVSLWESLNHMSAVVNGPWMVMGDFNNVLAMNERIGSEITIAESRGFQDCVANRGLMDTPAQEAFFIWNNKHDVGDMVFSRIGMVLINDEWLAQFPAANTIFHPEGLYDHCPCTITLWPAPERSKGCFKFFYMWGKDAEFLPTVKSIWETQIEGYTMFQIVKKLKALKSPLKALNKSSFANVEISAKVALLHLHEIQKKLHTASTNVDLQAAEKVAACAYRELDAAWRSFLSQKAKVHWMSDGDDNSTYSIV
ncbi:uncharacterized protein LOC141630212 [Silene latifolia]|uniref:uncharacterized protein LOC141630212 n=1 Tax=Silene latifolia TaxID=37657 RepID=UPI003D77D2B8